MADTEMEPPQEEAAPTGPVNFPLFSLLKTSHTQHGLKHGDYLRYRQYCARRLARLYKALKFLHGKNKYQKRTLDPAKANDERYFLMVLTNAERAWSYAMQLKNDGDGAQGKRCRHHLIARLSKAAKHAADLASLCATRGDARTALEAEAYSSWMSGNVLLEKETDWQAALATFLRARTVFEQLAKVGELEQQAVCRQRLEELEPSIRYCNYNLKKVGGGGGSIDELMALQKTGPGMDLLQSKLDAMVSEARSAAASVAGGVTSLAWRGGDVHVRSAPVQSCLAQAEEILREMSALGGGGDGGDDDKMMALYDSLLMHYADARQHVKDEQSRAASAEGPEGDLLREELAALGGAVVGHLLERTMDRNWMMVGAAKAKAKAAGRAPRAEGLVRLYDTLVLNLTELAESTPEDEGLHAEIVGRIAGVRAHRAAFVAQTYAGAGKLAEAYAVYGRAEEHAEAAGAALGGAAGAEAAAMLPALAELRAEVCVARAAVHARGLDEVRASREAVTAGLQGISLEAARDKFEKDAAQFLADGLDEFRSYLGEAKGAAVSIAELPPRMKAVPLRPILLDLALDDVEYPDLGHRAGGSSGGEGGEKQSLTSRLFGWGR